MAKQVMCECGYVARADTDEDVLAKIREHMRTDHPELLEKVTDEQILGWVEIV
jgi:predicted small metal-binding protein